ncbi:MAG: ABC transporter ATP-binding protein [Sedimentisphaerales bacterium]|nr:ABC transporter ATP-binding protein [Sedimentisphaerales bacterium]
MEVRVENLVKHFDKTKAVDDITFSFSTGQLVGFVGPNGAGKTTTIRILATLLEPTSGNAYLNGFSVVEHPEKARRMVGYVPDTLPMQRDMTVHDYLDFFARAYGVRAVRRRKVIEGIEEFTGLFELRDKFLDSLSKGMKQRVSLARSLVHDPPALILDEPAAGLDPRARIELRELLKVLARQGKAILISSHILTELSEICDCAVIIEQGRLLRAGKIVDMHQVDMSRRIIVVRPLDRKEEVYKELLQMPHVDQARWVGDAIEVETRGSEEIICAILAGLIKKNFRILEFKQHKTGLEDIFMNVTKGYVQ